MSGHTTIDPISAYLRGKKVNATIRVPFDLRWREDFITQVKETTCIITEITLSKNQFFVIYGDIIHIKHIKKSLAHLLTLPRQKTLTQKEKIWAQKYGISVRRYQLDRSNF